MPRPGSMRRPANRNASDSHAGARLLSGPGNPESRAFGPSARVTITSSLAVSGRARMNPLASLSLCIPSTQIAGRGGRALRLSARHDPASGLCATSSTHSTPCVPAAARSVPGNCAAAFRMRRIIVRRPAPNRRSSASSTANARLALGSSASGAESAIARPPRRTVFPRQSHCSPHCSKSKSSPASYSGAFNCPARSVIGAGALPAP